MNYNSVDCGCTGRPNELVVKERSVVERLNDLEEELTGLRGALEANEKCNCERLNRIEWALFGK